MADFTEMRELELSRRRLLVRSDLNVPLRDGRIADDARIRASLPAIRDALRARASVVLVSHLGRPRAGVRDSQLSLRPVAARLSQLLDAEVALHEGRLDEARAAPGRAVLCENIRFQRGECGDDDGLARTLASLCDVFVMDAFGCAHRAHASTHGVAKHAARACAGPLLAREVASLEKFFAGAEAARSVAVVGGAKVAGKMQVLEALAARVQTLIVGGGIANTLLAAHGRDVGRSLYDEESLPAARALSARLRERGCTLLLPCDAVCADELSDAARAQVKELDAVGGGDRILDLGPRTMERIERALAAADRILWNGPLGAFEYAPFAEATRRLAAAVARSRAWSLAGGGDTLAAIARFGVGGDVSFVSTGGGAFLEFVGGRRLPAIEILRKRKDNPRLRQRPETPQ